jgi:hypothetical protein
LTARTLGPAGCVVGWDAHAAENILRAALGRRTLPRLLALSTHALDEGRRGKGQSGHDRHHDRTQ